MSEAGRAKATFTWAPTNLVAEILKAVTWEARIQLANKALSIAATLNLEISDAVLGAPLLKYYDQVAHVLEEGRIPDCLTVAQPPMAEKSNRYVFYRSIASMLKGKCFLLCNLFKIINYFACLQATGTALTRLPRRDGGVKIAASPSSPLRTASVSSSPVMIHR